MKKGLKEFRMAAALTLVVGLGGAGVVFAQSEAEQAAINELNKNFARVEQIREFRVLPRQLSIEGGELTPTLKVKRNKVAEHFADIIDEIYAE